MHFQVLDLEVDPLQQGFEPAGYDVIIAGSVLHVCAVLMDALKNIRALLKPGGFLIFFEIIKPELACANVGFGLLEGWWSAKEKWRQYGPLATQQRWDALLRQTGFSGVEIAFRDSQNEDCHLTSIMVAKATQQVELQDSYDQRPLALLIDRQSDFQRVLAENIRKRYRHAELLALADLEGNVSDPSTLIVSLVEIGTPVLANLTKEGFGPLRTHLINVQDLLWVTSSPDTESCDPHLGLAAGFLRTIRTEHEYKHIVTLAIKSCSRGSEDEFVTQVLQTCFMAEPRSCELESIVSDDVLTIGRLEQDRTLDEKRMSHIHPRMVSQAWSLGSPLALDVGTPGMLDTLRFVEDPVKDLAADEVEIQAAVWPISFRDVFITLGRLGKEPLGYECAGTVSRVGQANSDSFSPGDRVLMLAPGCMRSHSRASADTVFKIPDNLTFNDAVAGMIPGMTAYHALVNIARLKPGEKVLIHAAAGSTGQMAVKIARDIGAEIFATVGTEEKRQLITNPDGLAIPSSHVFYSRDVSFKQGFMRVTGGYGVDVVLNSLSGDGLLASFACVAPYGRFVDIGKSDIMANSSLPMAGFARNISFSSVDLYHIAMTNDKLTRHLVKQVLALISKKSIGPPAPLHIYPVSKVEEAFRYMQGGKNTGRILVTLGSEDVVPTYVLENSVWRFEPNATYVVVGGFGGLGRAIVRWMVDKGARNFILPSRSGPCFASASEMILELTHKGATIIAPRCDASSAAELRGSLQSCAHLPPIKGCINSAVDLQDTVFENMTYTQWSRTIESKVNTSWNLHQLLPSDIDFFIMLSSLVGIQGFAQSNSAAGNIFQDSLARMRTTSRFKTSIALDLGWMHDIGMVTEREQIRRHRENTRDMKRIRSEDLFAVLDHFCDPALPAPASPNDSQLLVGIVTPDDFRARGTQPFPWLTRPLYAGFDVVRSNANARAKDSAVSARESHTQLFNGAADTEKHEIVVNALKHKLARILGVDPSEMDQERSLAAYRIDSLIAVELRNWIGKDLGASLTVFEIMDATRFNDVVRLVVERTQVWKP